MGNAHTEEARCLVCGRKLKSPKSVEAKMGYVCSHKLKLGYSGIQITEDMTEEKIKEIIGENR